MKKLIIPVLILLVACCALDTRAQKKDLSGKIGEKEREIQDLRDRIQNQRKKIGELEKQEKNEAEYLRKLRDEAALTKRLLDGLDEKKGMLGKQAEEFRTSLEENEIIYGRRLGILSKRLREIYKNGPRKAWTEVLSANDFSDLLQRYKFISLIAERDADLVDDVRKRRREIELQEARITEILYEVTTSRNEKKNELEKLEDNRAKRKRTIAMLQSDRKKYEKNVKEMASAEKRMQTFIEELEKTRLEQTKVWGEYGEKDFAALKGKLLRPVPGKTARRFGKFRHPEYGTVTYNTGIDIETRPGEPVRVVGRGRVEFSGALPGYGTCILSNHGGGYYTLYAHVARVIVNQGDQVERGGLIAETEGAGPGSRGGFHFEIRESKKALDPESWLLKGGR